jgi:exodeoxyribonuclease V beta subunit
MASERLRRGSNMSTPAKDWRHLPLNGHGRSLIEASAGTGKTWTISVLYLRLLLEAGLSPRQIVVSTFTNAAADELRGRLRARVTWALGMAQASDLPAADASDEAWLRQRWQDETPTRSSDIERLQLALSEMDMAPVSTLHSLCSRILADHPFAAGTMFRAGDLVNSDALLRDLADDLWRLVNQDEHWSLLADRCHAQKSKFGRENLRKKLACLLMPGAVVQCIDQEDIDAKLPREWASRIRSVCGNPAYFRANSSLQKNLERLATFIDWQSEDDRVLPNGTSLNVLRKAIGHSSLSAAGHASSDVAEITRFAADCVAIIESLQCNDAHTFWAEAQRWARTQLKARLAAGNKRSFDELLTTVATALQPPDGSRVLADALHAAWPVALIDEFQDTDPVQYGILDAIYSNADRTPRGRLVLIGDPKQAIYRFRGGDVHTYERAKGRVPETDRLSLATNHRSSAEYVEAVNEIYALYGGQLGAPASTTPIRYAEVSASTRQHDNPYCADSQQRCQQPLAVHLLDDAALDRDGAKMLALVVCANQIAALLSDPGHTIAGHRVQPSDIAVLLPSNAQTARLRQLLRKRGVPCVVTSRNSVFSEPVARDLLLLLHGVVHCHDPAVLRAALATRLWGSSYDTLRRMGDDPVAWQAAASRFHAWRALWQTLGLPAVINGIVDEVGVRHLQTTQGERVLTDLRHLDELLQEHAESADGMESVLAWFRNQLTEGSEDEDAADARSIRIESDAKRVQVMTLHASKGLEFSIVFLPLMWAQGPIPEKGLALMSDNEGQGRKLALLKRETDQVKADQQDERHRILYVALTRAVHACHAFAIRPGSAAAAKNQADCSAMETLCTALGISLDSNTAPDTRRIRWPRGWAPLGMCRYEAPADNASHRTARTLPAPPTGPLPRKHSFTSLLAGPRKVLVTGSAEDETTADDGTPASTLETIAADTALTSATRHPQLDALADIAGADFGNAVHGIFELRAPLQPLIEQRELVLAQLGEYAVQRADLDRERIADRLLPRLQHVLDTPLGGPDGPCLGRLPGSDMRAEMEFNYLLDGASLQRLQHAAEAAGYPGLVPPNHRQLAGLMNGKIDLVFRHGGRYHVLDYKGNHLGRKRELFLEHYAPRALDAAMDGASYRFQALLYVVALERYLQQRLGTSYHRATQLGDAWYLYIRAVGLSLPDGTPCGVWQHRFSDALLDAAQAELSRQPAQEAA